MVLVAALLVLAAVGLLVAGLAQGSAALQWASFAVSASAAVLIVVSELRRRRQARVDEAMAAAAPARSGTSAGSAAATSVGTARSAAADEDVEVRRAVPPPVPPSSPSIPRVPGPASGATAVSAAAPLRPASGPGVPAQQPAEEARPTGRAVASHSATDLPRAHTGDGPAPGGAAVPPGTLGADGEPPAEEVEVTDLLLVLDLTDEVLVVDEHPRYHLAGCPHLAGAETVPLPMDEARTDGFTPCGTCTPDRVLAERERARRGG